MRAGRIACGRSHADPAVAPAVAPERLLWTSTALPLSALYRSTVACSRERLTVNFFANRKSSWFIRSPYWVFGSTIATLTVVADDRLRPSDGATCTFPNVPMLVTSGPGTLWKVAES